MNYVLEELLRQKGLLETLMSGSKSERPAPEREKNRFGTLARELVKELPPKRFGALARELPAELAGELAEIVRLASQITQTVDLEEWFAGRSGTISEQNLLRRIAAAADSEEWDADRSETVAEQRRQQRTAAVEGSSGSATRAFSEQPERSNGRRAWRVRGDALSYGPRGVWNGGTAASAELTQGGSLWDAAAGETADVRTVSRAVQRDARRYDGGFSIY